MCDRKFHKFGDFKMFRCYFYAPSSLLLTQKYLKIKINEKNSQKVKMSSKNKPIVDLGMNGYTPKDIAKMLNKPMSTVYTVIKHFQMTGCAKRKPGSGSKRSLFQVKGQISWNPLQSMRKMAKELSVTTIRNKFRKDLNTNTSQKPGLRNTWFPQVSKKKDLIDQKKFRAT